MQGICPAFDFCGQYKHFIQFYCLLLRFVCAIIFVSVKTNILYKRGIENAEE